MPRLSESGPLGIRAEHWYDPGEQVGDSNLFVQVVAHIAAAAVPHPVLQYLTSGQVTPLAKPTSGHRPLFMKSFLRRLAIKSVMAAKKESVAKKDLVIFKMALDDVTVPTNTMIKTIQCLAEADPTRVLVCLSVSVSHSLFWLKPFHPRRV